jgi:hypothetical protein
MNELVRLRKENAELREKLRMAIEIVTEFLEKGEGAGDKADNRTRNEFKKNDVNNLKAVI